MNEKIKSRGGYIMSSESARELSNKMAECLRTIRLRVLCNTINDTIKERAGKGEFSANIIVSESDSKLVETLQKWIRDEGYIINSTHIDEDEDIWINIDWSEIPF